MEIKTRPKNIEREMAMTIINEILHLESRALSIREITSKLAERGIVKNEKTVLGYLVELEEKGDIKENEKNGKKI